MKRVQYIYLVKSALGTHMQFYQCWLDVVRTSGVKLKLLCILNPTQYLEQAKWIKLFQNKQFLVFKAKNVDRFAYWYLYVQSLMSSKLVLQVKRRSPDVVIRLKQRFPQKIKYIYEFEGDLIAEKHFSEYRLKGVDYTFKSIKFPEMERMIQEQKRIIAGADYVFVVTPEFKQMLCDRHAELDIDHKIGVLRQSYSSDVLYYDKNLRNALRTREGWNDKYIITYIGNALCPWQNLYRSIEIFKLLKENLTPNAFLLLLIREEDHHLANKFLQDLNVNSDDFYLSSVAHEEIRSYLCAADIGIALRHDHPMNRICTPGKLVDYMACGLPVIITTGISTFPSQVNQKNFGVVLENMDSNSEVLKKITPFLEHKEALRCEVAEWALDSYSAQALAHGYASALITVATS